MPLSSENVREYVRELQEAGVDPLLEAEPLPFAPSRRVGSVTRTDPRALDRRWALLNASDQTRQQLLDDRTAADAEQFAKNIENFIGTVKMPLGIAGPLHVQGLHTRGIFYVPLATTEAALVASYTRGCQAITEAGGCTAAVISTGVSRSPVFVFETMREAGTFILWLSEQTTELKKHANATTTHGKLRDVKVTMAANIVYVLLEFTTGDAAGQNMVTIAAQAVSLYINQASPIPPRRWYVEGNMSGDKKASMSSFLNVRGRKVTAEVILPADIVKRRLRVDVAEMVEYYHISALGGVMSGNIGIQGHYANGLTALFIACGQDAACVAEAAVGVTRMEMRPDGALQASVTLPNVIVGTVGGGTKLPSAQACLDLLKLNGAGHADAFAEVAGSLVLAGELSIIATLASGQFAGAHEKLARGKVE